jgi:hypothetical protein
MWLSKVSQRMDVDLDFFDGKCGQKLYVMK